MKCTCLGAPSRLRLLSVLGALLPSLLGATEPPGQPVRPRFAVTTTERFDAARFGTYEGSHPRVYEHIDAHLEEHLANLQRWVRQPSISSQDVGMAAMAEMLRSDLETLGFAEAELVPTEGFPGVWGFYDAGAPKSLVIYMMYDVQPVVPEAWKTPPFEGNLVDVEGLGTVLMARGASNQKGPERTFLNALESILAVDGDLPVNLMVVADGEEEIGSPHYGQVVARYADRLEGAEGVVLLNNNQWVTGYTEYPLGVKGLLYLELTTTNGLPSPVHSSYQAVIQSPALRLVQALASLTSADGTTITVPGYYDKVRPPSETDMTLLNAMSHDWEGMPLLEGLEGEAATVDLLFLPTLNVSGLASGFSDVGLKTILPNTAKARLDSRLVPDMTPEEAYSLIRAHLDRGGFEDVETDILAAFPPGQSDLDTPLVRAVVATTNKWVPSVAVAPRSGGAGPLFHLTGLGLSFCPVGLGYSGASHAPDEFLVIHPAEGVPVLGLADVEKSFVDFLYALGTE